MKNRIALPALLLCAAGLPAFAHAHLVKGDPAAGETLKESPAQVELHFTEALEPAFSSIAVTDEKGRSVNAGPSLASGTVMRVTLKKLAPGKYHVAWVSVAIDTHRTSGGYVFTIRP